MFYQESKLLDAVREIENAAIHLRQFAAKNLRADKSNAEIGQTMDIKLTTVKTHVSHVLEKLGVKRRNEAKTAAKKLWLVPEEL